MLRPLAQTLFLLSCLGSILSAAEPHSVWLDVPFIKQEKNACGAAAVAMIMQYWSLQQGRPSTASSDPAHIQDALYSPEARGIYNSAIEQYLRNHNFRTFTIHGEWADLQQHLEKGRPLIVVLKPERQAQLHYVVVAGMDTAQNLVLLNDPAQRKLLKLDRSSFEKSWNAAGNWTLLALPLQVAP